MAAPKRASKAEVATAPSFVDAAEKNALWESIQRQISERAYQLYEESGYAHGGDQRHWLQAESEVLRRELEVKESGSWLMVSGSLPGIRAEDVQIYVDERRILVRAAKERPGPGRPEGEPGSLTDFYLVADLVQEVAPATAAASLKEGKLSLMVKKRSPTEVEPIRFAPIK